MTEMLPVRFPVLLLEWITHATGNLVTPGALTPGDMPLPLVVLTNPMIPVIVGRVDALRRQPGELVTCLRTGTPFPTGTWVWSATGAVFTDSPLVTEDPTCRLKPAAGLSDINPTPRPGNLPMTVNTAVFDGVFLCGGLPDTWDTYWEWGTDHDITTDRHDQH